MKLVEICRWLRWTLTAVLFFYQKVIRLNFYSHVNQKNGNPLVSIALLIMNQRCASIFNPLIYPTKDLHMNKITKFLIFIVIFF